MADHNGNGAPDERTHLLPQAYNRRLSRVQDNDTESFVASNVSKDELALGQTAIGERLPYNDYTTIDWLHDLVRCALPP
jgi:chloride channel 3/4/5